MNRRTVEFFLVLVVAAVVAAFSLREKAEKAAAEARSPLADLHRAINTAIFPDDLEVAIKRAVASGVGAEHVDAAECKSA